MPTRSSLILALVLFLGGCATYDENEIAQFHHLGVPPPLLEKLEHRRPLLPEDLIALRRLRVPDPLVIRHLNRVGVDYVVTRADISQLRKADVRPEVIDSLVRASDRFVVRRFDRAYDGWYWGDPWYWPGAYGGYSVDYWYGHGGHDHHDHDGHHWRH
jgi:hypothetical protein